MLDLTLFGDAGAMARVAAGLDAITGTARVRVVEAARPGKAVVRADVAHDAVDDVLDELERLPVPASDVSLARVELVGRVRGTPGRHAPRVGRRVGCGRHQCAGRG